MITEVEAGPYTVRGVSVGGVYTSLQVPQLGAVFDAGIAPRAFAATDHLFISHGHGDHIGALPAMMGIRGLLHKDKPRVYLPKPIVDDVQEALRVMTRMQRYDLSVTPLGMEPGDELQLRADLHVRAFRTHHPVPSLGYLFFDRVKKLKPEYAELPGAEIGRRRKAGDDLFHEEERLELAYATDTLLRVIDTCPDVLRCRVLVMECSFLDDKKSLADSRAGCHIHLDELLERADDFENEHLVLMHFSQIYQPREVVRILRQRCPPHLLERIVPFVPASGSWP